MDTHHTQELAREGVARVQICSCGNFHLAVGPVALTLTPDAFTQVCTALGRGQASLGATRAPERPALQLVTPRHNN